MAEIIPFATLGQAGPPKMRRFEEELERLRQERVPPEKREAVARALGRLAARIGPTPKRGAGRMLEMVGQKQNIGQHRKRIMLLDGENPAKTNFRAAWADYIALAKAAADLLVPESPGERGSHERDQILRSVVNARVPGELPNDDDMDPSRLVRQCFRRILKTVKDDDRQFIDFWTSDQLSEAALAYDLDIPFSVSIPLGAVAWDVSLDAFHFPTELVKQCPGIFGSGAFFWEDPESSDEARIFERWINDLGSDCAIPDIKYGQRGPFGWRKSFFRIYRHVALTLSTRRFLEGTAPLCLEIGIFSPGDYRTPVMDTGGTKRSAYAQTVMRGEEIYGDWREDDFARPGVDICGEFPYIYVADPEFRGDPVSKAESVSPLLIDEEDANLIRHLEDITEELGDYRPDDPHVRALLDPVRRDYLPVSDNSLTHEFLAIFDVDTAQPVPASDGTFASCLLRNMAHAPKGKRVDELLVAELRRVKADVREKIDQYTSLIEQYRRALED